jgi:hypothetical protein
MTRIWKSPNSNPGIARINSASQGAMQPLAYLSELNDFELYSFTLIISLLKLNKLLPSHASIDLGVLHCLMEPDLEKGRTPKNMFDP